MRVGLAAVVVIQGLLWGSTVHARDASDFASFWSDFQSAVRSGDAKRLAALTAFPLQVAGQLDSDAVRLVSPASFRASSRRFLAQDVGLSAKEEPMRAFVLRTPAPAVTGAGPVRIGTFRFEQRAGHWRLVRVVEER